MSDKAPIYVKINDEKILEMIDNIGKKAKNPKKIMRLISRIMLVHTDENFETQGKNADEVWEDWSEPYKIWRQKNNYKGDKKLILENEMREGISRKVTNDSAMVYSDKIYSAIHNFGGPIKRRGKTVGDMPKRTFMKWTEDLKQEILDEVGAELLVNEKYDDSFVE